MEEILRAKLSTIKEEPELCDENFASPRHVRLAKKQGKKKRKNVKKKNGRRGNGQKKGRKNLGERKD